MLSDCQLQVADDYNISIGNIKKLFPAFFGKEKYTCFVSKTCNFI